MERSILTAQADAFALALAEAGNPRVLRAIEPGVALCEGAKKPKAAVFLRHMCPAETEVQLTGSLSDIDALKTALAQLLPRLEPNTGFSVQTRVAEGYQPPYKRFDVNTALAEAAQAAGAALDVKKPGQVISVMLAEGTGWIGVSNVCDNLSDWAGGARRYKWEETQISRAEFKLLEALEVFGVALPDNGRALDLGAAPGGWTRILRRHGLYVTAVDPAELDPRLSRDKRVTHLRATAQVYFRNPQPCDVMVNDMKMDTAQSAALMVEGAHCLKQGGVALMTLKLPEKPSEWLPRVESAATILQSAYRVAGLRQLFHNRSEVTACLVRA